jgi:hypothetical protein
MIAPPAVERWADRAIERTIPSLLQTWLAGVLHQEQFVRAQPGRKGDVLTPDTVERVDRLIAASGAFDDCVAFVQEAIGIGAAMGGPVNVDYYRNLVRREVERISNTIRSGDFTGWLADFWRNTRTSLRHPMTSLRDVDEPGRIWGSRLTTDNKEVSDEQVAAAMVMVRNRGAGRRRHTTLSEMDSEGQA